MTIPVAPRRPHVWTGPAGERTDPYAWIRRPDDPDTLDYLAEENAWADAWFNPLHDDIAELFGEIKSRVKEDDTSYPVAHRGWWYVSRTETGKSYAIHSRGHSPERAAEHLLLDENVEASAHDYFSLNAFEISHSGDLLAWSCDTDGSEHYTLRVRDVRTGADLPDVIEDTTWGGVAWSRDDRYLFYVTPDDAMRPWQVWRHEMGRPSSEDSLVFEDPDERFFVGVGLTRSDAFIVIESSSRTSSECLLLPSDDATADPLVVMARRDDVEYQVDHWGDRLAMVTNLEALDFSVLVAPISEPSAWTPLVPHVPGQRITQFECFEKFAVMQRWIDGQQVLSIVAPDGRQTPIPVLSEPHDAEFDANPDYAVGGVRISYQSLTIPRTTAEYDVSDGRLITLKRVETPNCDLALYTSRREWATAPDGTLVPLDIVHRTDTPLDGTAPALLYVYGSYEASMPPWFSAARLSLLDRGWVWALAHPRGGGEMGRQWYLDGKLLAKRNTFEDTLACADHLAAASVCDATRIVVRGGSAGGLCVGACITMRPGRFAGAIAEVPFVDIVTTMSDPSLPLTVTEWEEWGDPRSEPFASYMLSYSPYDNVRAVRYPDLYVTAGLNDPRVGFHEPTKWVAKIRHESPESLVVLRCEMGAGHGGPSGRYEQWRDEARTLAFALRCVN